MTFADRLRNREAVTGTMLRLVSNAGVVALCKQAGFDLVMLDMEHGPYDFHDVAHLSLVGHGLGLAVMVRVPELSKDNISRALDCGVDGVMVPMLETVEQAKMLVKLAKFMPTGGRGLGSMGGHTAYKNPGEVGQFMKNANHQTFAIAQIETRLGIANIDAIAAVDGIDALVIGPNDMANALGNPGQMTHPDQEKAMQSIADAARKHDRIFGMHAGTDLLQRWAPQGMTLFLNAMEMQVLAKGLAELCQTTRQLAGLNR